MFESNPSFQNFDTDLSPDTLNVESILLNSDLPKSVRTAAITQVFKRSMDDKEIARLTSPHQPNSENSERLKIRRNALVTHRDSILMCVLIRLPGVTYTIEICPLTRSVIHWEWIEL